MIILVHKQYADFPLRLLHLLLINEELVCPFWVFLLDSQGYLVCVI